MSEDTDPMLGDEATREKYQAMVTKIIEEAVQSVREERRAAAPTKDSDPVMLGDMGFNGGIAAAG